MDGSAALIHRLPRDHAPGAPGDAARAGTYPVGFVLFLLLTGVMFVRPAEILPSLKALPIYEMLMLACLATSFPALLQQVSPRSLLSHPVTACVLGLVPAIVLSHLSHGNLYRAREGALAFVKLVLFFMLLVGLVNSPARLRRFLIVAAFYIFVIASLALLQEHGLIYLEALVPFEMKEGYNEELGDRVVTIRLQASGIFNDPNDFSLILVVGILIAGHVFLESGNWLHRLAILVPLAAYMYALALTRSRGGLLALVAGGMVLLVTRFGWRKAVPMALVGLPVLLLGFGGRQTNFNFGEEDTGHGRVSIWQDAIGMFRASPVFGAGEGMMEEELHIAAHNSFIHAFAELGFVGGGLFLGAFFLPAWFLQAKNLSARPAEVVARESADVATLRGWRPCVLAVLCAYTIGLLSLSRAYTVTTYMIVGIAAAYLSVAAAYGVFKPPASGGAIVRRVCLASFGCLFGLYVFVRLVV